MGVIPDTPSAVVFLAEVSPQHQINLVAINKRGKVVARSFGPGEAVPMGLWIEGQQGRANLYFHVNELKPGARDIKARKEDMARAHYLHVDVDDMAALDRIKNYAPSPTAIVFSGGGYQAFWRLAAPSDDLARVEAINMAIANALGGDHCHNVDRIMRLPGTINIPNAKKQAAGRKPELARIIEADWSRTYNLGDFPQGDGSGPAGPKDGIMQAAVVPVDLDVLPPSVMRLTRTVIEFGDDPERPLNSDAPHFRSRSEAVFRVACDLARAGCAQDIIAGVLVNPAFGISRSILEKKDPEHYALRQARSALAAVSDGWPDCDRNRAPKPTRRNALVALQRLGLSFAHNLFSHRKVVNGTVMDEHQGEISDDACAALRGLIIETFNFDPRAENVRDAVTQLCLEHTFHPIRQMLDGLVWDGVPRLDGWLTSYMGAEDTLLNNAVSRITLIAAVRRVREPGVKFDTIVIFEGKQGTGKSTALQILAGPGNHADNEILSLPQKEQMEAMEGVWIYELSEMSGLSKSEAEKTKAFASRQFDKARMYYGRFSERRGRQAIFVGTTNESKYLKDRTGNRRFLPVKTGAIDLEALRRDRDQLWAEAAHREAQGESIVLPQELWAVAAAEQDERLEDDPWLEPLSEVQGKAFGDEVRVSTSHLLGDVLKIEVERQHNGHTKRLAGLMRSLGWEPGKFKVAGKTQRGFCRPKPEDHADDKPPAQRPIPF